MKNFITAATGMVLETQKVTEMKMRSETIKPCFILSTCLSILQLFSTLPAWAEQPSIRPHKVELSQVSQITSNGQPLLNMKPVNGSQVFPGADNSPMLLSISVNSVAAAPGGSGGGNSCSWHFARLGRVVYDVIKNNTYYQARIDLKKLKNAINNTTISVAEGKLHDRYGGLVPAKNDGVGQIIISNEDWCKTFPIRNHTAIVLHEYLGISEPGYDSQYLMSGPLYVQTGRDDMQFETFLQTGSDFEIKKLYFGHLLEASHESAVIETKSIKEFFGIIYIVDSARYQFRTRIDCTAGNERLELVSIYAAHDSQQTPQWIYQETPLNTFRFNDPSRCMNLKNRAQFIVSEGLEITFVMDSLRIIGQF